MLLTDREDHQKWCALWFDELDCTCDVRWQGYEDDDIPIRVSKSAPAKHVVSNRSIFTLWETAKRRGERMKSRSERRKKDGK